MVLYKKIIPIVKTTMKICQLVSYFGESCPISAGTHTVSYTQTFPSYALSVSISKGQPRAEVFIIIKYREMREESRARVKGGEEVQGRREGVGGEGSGEEKKRGRKGEARKREGRESEDGRREK